MKTPMTTEEREARKKDWLMRLAFGDTLQAIANDWGVTRERVRQVVGPDSPRRYRLRQEDLEYHATFPNLTAIEISNLSGYKHVQTKKLKALGWTPPPKPDPEHGTRARYMKLKCRCEECRAAVKHQRDEWLSRVRGNPPMHGTANGYFNYRCRCEECKKAGSEKNKISVKAWKERKRLNGTDSSTD